MCMNISVGFVFRYLYLLKHMSIRALPSLVLSVFCVSQFIIIIIIISATRRPLPNIGIMKAYLLMYWFVIMTWKFKIRYIDSSVQVIIFENFFINKYYLSHVRVPCIRYTSVT